MKRLTAFALSLLMVLSLAACGQGAATTSGGEESPTRTFTDSTGRTVEVPEQITGFEYQVEACMKAMAEGKLECDEMPHSEILYIMRQMDALRAQWGMVYPFD